MDQGDPSSQHDDSNFNLYDTYGTGMDDDSAIDATFGMGGWDHHDHQGGMVYPDISGTGGGYDPSATNMGDFVSTDYGHQFQHTQSFGHDGQHYQDFMVQDSMGDQQTVHNQEFDLNAMDLYQHTASLYPNLTQEAGDYELVDQNQNTPSSMSIPQNNSIDSVQPTAEGAQHNNTAASTATRQGFKFSPEQKQLMMDKFSAGLHYPTNTEKDSLAAMLGVSTESISRWFERTRKEKGVQRARKAQEIKPIQMPQYHPIQTTMQPQLQPAQQSNTNPFPSYGQFPSTYPYNTLNPHFFQQNLPQSQAPPQTTTVNPSAGMYAPIPFVNPPFNQQQHPGMQNLMDMNPNGSQLAPQIRPKAQGSVDMSNRPMVEGVYMDDTRNVKRPKIEPRLIPAPPKELAPKAKPPKKPMTFDEEVLSILRPAEWRDDPVQAAEDFYDLMGDAEESPSQKLFLLRAIRNSATEIALRTISNEENRRILAKLRNWFTAAIKANDKPLLSVILEVIKKMNIDGRTMAGIKLGKPLILLMKKDEPTLKAQLASLQKTAYEAYALEKDGGAKPLTENGPSATAPGSTTASNTAASSVASTATKAATKVPVSTDKPQTAAPSKIKVASKPAASFFGKLAQTSAIPKTPVLAKSIPKKPPATTPSSAMIAGGAVKPPSTTSKSVPPKPTIPAPAKSAPSKFSVLEFINRGDSADNSAKTDTADTKASVNPKKRKHVSWAAEGDLERVQMIENITIKYAEDLFWHPPQAFGNARDLDIGEGRAFGKDTVEYDVEEEIEWYEPKLFDFTVVKEAAEDRGVKRAGNKVADAREAEVQKAREAGVLLVTYLNDGDIPDSPSEPFLEELVSSSQQSLPPKVIPLPQELRSAAGAGMTVQSVKGQMPNNPDVTAILSSLLAGSTPTTYQAPAPVQPAPDLASLLQSLSGAQPTLPLAPAPLPQASGIPANIDLSALLSHLQTQPAPQQQRWTSPPPSTYPRREERHREPEPARVSKTKRENASRIKASRQDDVREGVRTSTADQNNYRALCQFYKTGGCRVGDACTFVHPRDMAMYDQQ